MKLLMVDDNYELCNLYRQVFAKNLIVMDFVGSVEELKGYDVTRYDVVILDLNLPDGSGFDILKYIRATNLNVPIIMLSARKDSDTVIKGLELGADDYIRKPVEIDELIARVNSIYTRRNLNIENVYERGNLKIDFQIHKVFVNDEVVEFTQKHYLVLELLANNEMSYISSSDIFFKIYDEYNDEKSSALRVHIFNIKKKLLKAGSDITIKSAKSKGYKLCEIEE